MIEIKIINENKRDFMDLLLLGDEQESMVEKYIDQGVLFALYDHELKGICLVTFPEEKTFEIKNVAVYPTEQRKGYGRILVEYALHYFRYSADTMLVGTGECDSTLNFYKSCGFQYSHRVENFFIDNYDHPIYENGIQLIDMVYLKKELKHRININPDDIIFRPEEPCDYAAVEQMVRDAFWNVYQPGCDEHYLVHILRNRDSYLPELHYIAEYDGQIVGNILYTRNTIIDTNGFSHEVLGFGPLSVLPSYQRNGIGERLVEITVKIAKQLGYKAILICGNPAYYHRFGFCSASEYGIVLSDGSTGDFFMALELYDGALSGISGKYYEDEAFHSLLNKTEVEKFDTQYEKRYKVKTPTQL